MSLLFSEVKVKNFGPFYGEQVLNLASPQGSSVILVHGENTLGKTQLFSALRWGLYGNFEHAQSEFSVKNSLHDRLNRIAAREGAREIEVELKFVADEPYHLIRRASVDGQDVQVTASLRIGTTSTAASAIDTEIGRLLHPQIADFFLFDAELLQRFYDRLNSDRERAFIRESIESVLGIPALQRAAKDVAELGADATKRQAQSAKDRAAADALNGRLRKYADRRRMLERDKAELQEQLRSAEHSQSQLREQMASVEGLQADARDQELYEARLADVRRSATQLKAEMKGLLGSGWIAAAASPLTQVLQEVRARNTRAQREQQRVERARLKVSVLEDRTRGGVCPTCGQALPAADSETQIQLAEARAELEQLLQENGGGRVDLDTERALAALANTRTAVDYREKHDRLSEQQMTEYELERNLKGIVDRLRGHNASSIRALGQKMGDTERAIAMARDRVGGIEKDLQQVGADEQAAMRRLTKLASTQPDAVIEATFFAYVRAALDETISRYRDRVRSNVERAANRMFLRLIRDPQGYGGLTISPDYRVQVLDRLKAPRATSEGGKQLLALSLIGALKHAAVRGGPVVLDSPLGRLDLEHRANVLQTWIPALGNQAVLLVQSGELTVSDAHRLLGSTLGREYRIVRPTGDPEYALLEEMS